MSPTFLDESLAVLTRGPASYDALLRGLPEAWTKATEGPGTWSPYDVLGHLVHAEKADWIPRIEIILQYGETRPFEPFDREAQFRDSEGKTLETLLDEFGARRRASLERLGEMELQPEQFELQGTHPALGPVTVGQLLATWTAHDMAHLIQVGRVIAKRYKSEVGPFAAFLSVMK